VSYHIAPLAAGHERAPFDCGDAALNDFLRRFARQNQQRGVNRTFVALPHGSNRVVGFYSLSAGAVAFTELPGALRRSLPRYPVPVAHLARLATCFSVRGRGLGEALLFDALQRVERVSGEIGIVGVEVRAKHDGVRSFYARYGFVPLVEDPLRLYLPLRSLRITLQP
jgi:GNAT superfamily N-acetyltransferase